MAKTYTASVFGGPSDPGTGTTGYRGKNLASGGGMYFAELSNNYGAGVNGDFKAMGGLKKGTKVRVTYKGRSVVLTKADVGAGGPGLNGRKRGIDIWYEAAQKLKLNGLGNVKVEVLDGSHKGETTTAQINGGTTKQPAQGVDMADIAARALLSRSKNPGKGGSLLKDMLYLKSLAPDATAKTADAVQSTAKEAGKRAPATPSGANPWKIPAQFGLTVSSGSRPGSITTSGNVSDHAGQGEGTMARDFSGSVAQMDKAAKAMARRFGISEKAIMKGGLFNVTKDGWRYQLIYRTNIGGNHYNHIHLGRRKA